MKTIERYVITALMRDMRAAGYQVAAVHVGDGYVMARTTLHRAPATIAEPMTDAKALEAIDSVDRCTLHFTDRNSTEWGDHGVLIILGNGEDCLSDSHSHENEPFNGIIDAIYDKLNAGSLLDSSDTSKLLPALQSLVAAINVKEPDALIVFASIERARAAIAAATGEQS